MAEVNGLKEFYAVKVEDKKAYQKLIDAVKKIINDLKQLQRLKLKKVEFYSFLIFKTSKSSAIYF